MKTTCLFGWHVHCTADLQICRMPRTGFAYTVQYATPIGVILQTLEGGGFTCQPFCTWQLRGGGGRTKEDPVEWIPFRSVSFQRGEGMPLREYITVRMYVCTYSYLQWMAGSWSEARCRWKKLPTKIKKLRKRNLMKVVFYGAPPPKLCRVYKSNCVHFK